MVLTTISNILGVFTYSHYFIEPFPLIPGKIHMVRIQWEQNTPEFRVNGQCI